MTIGILIAVVTFAIIVAFYLNAARNRRRAQQFIQTTGRPARARILNVSDTGVTVNNNPRINMTIQVEAEGIEPYTITKSSTVSRLAIPRAGEVYEAYYDPANLKRVVIQLGSPQPA